MCCPIATNIKTNSHMQAVAKFNDALTNQNNIANTKHLNWLIMIILVHCELIIHIYLCWGTSMNVRNS